MRWSMTMVALSTLAVAVSPPPSLRAQQGPAFEVVSIKPNTSPDLGARIVAEPSGRLLMTNMPLSGLVFVAYELQDAFQVEGLPEWAQKERFDVEAQAPAGVRIAFPGQGTALPRMLQAVLADRMKMASHVEQRTVPMFELVKARSDGSLGPKLTRSTLDCTTAPSAPPPDARQGQAPADGPKCGARATLQSFSAPGIPLDRVIRLIIAPRVGRPVIDRTGLTGTFDIDLRFKGSEPQPGAVATGAPTPDPDLPPIETALQEQLGLRLRSIREPANVLVIDRLERPTPN